MLQLYNMESKKKVRKVARPSSSDSSSDSDSSSSSSSEETRRKQKHRNIRKQQRESSSSSEEEAVRKSHKHASHKKSSSVRKHSAKVRTKLVLSSGKKTARSMSPASRAAHKHHLKAKMAAKKLKLAQLEEHDRRSRTPTRRDVKKDRTPDHRITTPTTRIRVSVPNNRAVQERSAGRGIKESPSSGRRHVREPAGDKERAEILARCQERQRERDRIRRVQEDEERYKQAVPRSADRSSRMLPTSSHVPVDKHHHERSRSHSRGKVPIRERLDKEYDYRRSISREHEDYAVMRPGGAARESIGLSYSRERPALRDELDRNFDYRGGDERRIGNHEYGQPSRNFEERPHRGQNWDNEREVEPRNNRVYEGREWDQPSHSKRVSDESFKDQRDRSWNDQPRDKWSKEKDQKEWNRNWKEPSSSGTHHGPPSSSVPTMAHPRRWQGPSETWTPRGSHKMEHSPSSGPPFKPRFSSSAPHFGFKRFPFKRFPNQYSKINYPSKRVIPSGSSSALGQGQSSSLTRTPIRISENSMDSPMKSDVEQLPSTPGKVEASESGEITTEPEEDKVEADTTTFGGNVETQSQDECEGNLSEFSDVDDEILNREEVNLKLQKCLVMEKNENFSFSLFKKHKKSTQLSLKIEDAPSRLMTRASALRLQSNNVHVNNRIFSPFSSDYYCIYGLLPRHTDGDGRRVS